MQKRLITICILTLGISAKSAHAQFSKTIRHLSVSTEDNNAAPLQLDAHDIDLDGFVALTDFVGVADFDADGDFDLCAANGTSANPNFALLIWYENDGAGNFTKHILNNFINWVNAALPLDVNSDGRPDIYLEMGNLQADFWYENLGNGAFSQRQSFFPPGADEPTFVNQRVAVDLDGRQDLVFSSDDSDESRIFGIKTSETARSQT